MAKKIPYIDIKNYLHNELGLDRKQVLDFAEKYVEKHVSDRIDRMTQTERFEKMLINRIAQIITKRSSSDAGILWVEKVIQNVVKDEIINKIDFDKLYIPLKPVS